MQNVEKLINDIFSMEFDIIIPISGTIVAVIVAFIVFMLRYLSFRLNRWLYRNAPPRNAPTAGKARSRRKDWHNILPTASFCDPRTKRFLQQSIEKAQANIAGENGICPTFCDGMLQQVSEKMNNSSSVEIGGDSNE